MNWLQKLRSTFSPSKKTEGKASFQRPYSVAQVEITSRCATNCQFCPQTILRENWVGSNMSLDLFRETIAPDLDQFEMVYLQGWGEPLLHPDLWEMLALAKAQGCRTGFTTNGLVLTEDSARRIVELEVDIISCSLAGATADLHESLRCGTSFSKILENIGRLLVLRGAAGSAKPWVELHYLMTRRNLHELPAFVHLAADLGVDEAVATNLTYTPIRELDEQRVFGDPPDDWAQELVDAAQTAASERSFNLRIYPLAMNADVLVCDADPLNSVYIGQAGEVAPCVYLGLSIAGQVPRYFERQYHPTERYIYGHTSQSLRQVLDGRRRKDFLHPWQARNLHAGPMAGLLLLAGETGAQALPDPPSACRMCYKRYGV
jgi:MoaA/NifB/PqqE/SkfB family radical SAM enzyme